jgi:hypothetical protein
MLVIVSAVVMIAIAFYAHSTVAPGAATLPLHWSLAGKADIRAPRLVAFAVVPVIGIVALLVLTLASAASMTAMVLVAALFVVIQLLHIWLIRRWFAAAPS